MGSREMNYEQKYKESMLIAEHHVMNGALSQDEAEALFPELRESEDERIRKEIIAFLKHYHTGEGDSVTYNDDWIAYLEKLKESLHISETCKEKADSFTDEDEMIRQTLLDYFSKYSHICMWGNFTRDQIVAYLESLKEQKPLTVEDVVEQSKRFRREVEVLHKDEQKPVDDKAFEEWVDDWWRHNKVNNPDSYDKGDEIQFDERGFKNFCRGIRNMYQQKPAEWSEEDEKNRHPLNTKEIKIGDIITYFSDGKKGIMLVSSFDAGKYPRCKWGISHRGTAYGDWAPGSGPYYSATAKEKLQLYDTMPPEVKAWLKSLRPQLKQEWSKKDKKIVRALQHALNCADAQNAIAKSGVEVSEVATFLQDLIPSWKPSEEQMAALYKVAYTLVGTGTETDGYLVQLYEQLKALM